MIRIQGRAVVYGELWFEEEPPANAGVDVLIYRFRRFPIPHARTTKLQSLCTDLTGPVEAIAAGFHSGCRYQIRRAETQDRLAHQVIPEAQEGLEEFIDFYDAFAQQKGLAPADRHWLARAAAARQLTLSCVCREGERLVWHAHLRCGRTAGLAYSASWFRAMDSEHRALVGRANRWLHWQDMLHLARTGAQLYDWGGVFADESTAERAGINRFKKMFGGEPVPAYECTVPVTLRGRAFLALRDNWRSWRAPAEPAPAAALAPAPAPAPPDISEQRSGRALTGTPGTRGARSRV